MAIATKENRHNNKKQKACARAELAVDYPRQGETIAGVNYTFRVAAPENVQKVEVAIDQAEWRPCRQSAGYWWCDWSGYENGEHEIAARVIAADGRTISSEPHEFFVQFEKQPA